MYNDLIGFIKKGCRRCPLESPTSPHLETLRSGYQSWNQSSCCFFGERKGVQLFRDLNSCNKNIKRVLPRVCGAASVQAVAVRALCECKVQLFFK